MPRLVARCLRHAAIGTLAGFLTCLLLTLCFFPIGQLDTKPITLVKIKDAVAGTISEAGARVAAGAQLQLRTYSGNSGSQPNFTGLTATVEVERD